MALRAGRSSQLTVMDHKLRAAPGESKPTRPDKKVKQPKDTAARRAFSAF